MLLRGYSNSGQKVDFSLSDCPIFISEGVIALAGIKMSQLLKVSTIVRGDKSTGIFEGDIVKENDEVIGYVLYSKGFKMQDLQGVVKNIPESRHIQLIEGDSKTVKFITGTDGRTPLAFDYRGERLSLNNFLAKSGENIATTGNVFNKNLIKPNLLKFYTGINSPVDNKELYFGDIYEGGIVVLHKYLPAIKINEEYKMLSSE